jgi:hypothetical protein
MFVLGADGLLATTFRVNLRRELLRKYPDTNLVNNTVVTIPFVANSQLFNDRPPAAPTRTFGDFFQGAPIVNANPNPGKPCSFGMVPISCDTPNMTSALCTSGSSTPHSGT